MNESKRAPGDVNLLQVLAVPLRRWRAVLVIFGATILLALAYALLAPPRYTARTTLMPMQSAPDVSNRLAALMGDLPLGLSVFSPGGREEGVVTILKSRSVADSVIQRLRLKEDWGVGSQHDARLALANRTQISRERQDGHIIIEYSDSDPTRAARVANAYPDILNLINSRLSAEAALRRAEFLEQQLAIARQDLEQAEAELVEFQRSRGAPEIEEQARQTIIAAAQLQEKVIEKEVEVSQLRRVATAEHPQLRQAMAELAALRAQLARITVGEGDRMGSDPLLSFREAPELGATYGGLLREYKKNEQLFAGLTAGLAEARIQAATNLPVVAVLDPAVVPEVRSSPQRRRVMMLAGVGGILLGLFAAFLVEWKQNFRRTPEGRELAARFHQTLREMKQSFGGSRRNS